MSGRVCDICIPDVLLTANNYKYATSVSWSNCNRAWGFIIGSDSTIISSQQVV